MVRKRFLVLVMLVLAAYYGKTWVEQNVEIVTLHTRSEMQHFYTRVFVVDDDARVVWVRAERPDRLWLEALREEPEVVLRRGGRDVAYHAEPWNGSGGHRRIDALFRSKYGVFDRLSALAWRRDAVPVRLEPVSDY